MSELSSIATIFNEIATSINAKGVTGTMTPEEMPGKIASIPTGIDEEAVVESLKRVGEPSMWESNAQIVVGTDNYHTTLTWSEPHCIDTNILYGHSILGVAGTAYEETTVHELPSPSGSAESYIGDILNEAEKANKLYKFAANSGGKSITYLISVLSRINGTYALVIKTIATQVIVYVYKKITESPGYSIIFNSADVTPS